MSITKEELVHLAEKGYYEFDDRLETTSSKKLIAEYNQNLIDIGSASESWGLELGDINALNRTLFLEIKLTTKEYAMESPLMFAKACIAHMLV